MKRFLIIMLMFASGFSYSQGNVHVGEILCTDNTFVSSDDFASSGKTALGIVFFVDKTQRHGWALALNDAGSEEITWGDTQNLCYLDIYNTNTTILFRDTIGAARCDSIARKAQGIGWSLSTFSSAVAAAVQCGDGWYLPSIGQLMILYANLPEINSAIDAIGSGSKMTGQKYWSCTEENVGVKSAWMMRYNGGPLVAPKSNTANVRAIRNF